jgi:hypothetical protein
MKKIFTLLIFIVWSINIMTAQDSLSILLVQDNSNTPARIADIKATIDAAGYSYTVFDAVTEKASPTAEFMSNFELVIWYAGNDNTGLYFWNGNDTENTEIKAYLANGGMLWLQSLEFLYDRYPTYPKFFVPGDFEYDYLGIKTFYERAPGNNNPTIGVPQFDTVPNNITSVDPLLWSFATMWRVEACEITNSATGVYKMGPSTHYLSPYYGGIYNEITNGFKAFTLTTETARLKDTANYTNPLFKQTLNYFNQFAKPKVFATAIDVTSDNSVLTLGLNDTLQMFADITPANASNSSVTWSLNSGSTSKINQVGRLIASNVAETIWVKATTNDGTNLSDSLSIEIKSLVDDSLSILLVHDNSSDIARVEKIKAAITANNYKYTYFDAVANNSSPTAEYLSNFELVIWYTGNDENGTYLWNGNDTDNEALKTYLNNGGMLWLQGLNFLYDRYGVAPHTFTETDFAYKYMGINKFTAESYINDGSTGVSRLDVVAGNGICALTPLTWLGSDSPMHYVDGCELNGSTQGVYKMGPAGYALENYFSGFYKDSTFNALTFTFEPSRMNDPVADNIDSIYNEVLNYFNTFANTHKSHVYDVQVSSATGAVSILEENGTLQMQVAILPSNADNKSVTWSLTANSVPATISQDGLLTASGTIEGNGSVWVVATSNDRPEIADTLEISIIGQAMDGFTVLLVNDNAVKPTRYLNIETALKNSGYTSVTFDAVTRGFAPDSTYLKNFEMVIWYSGGNGVNLKFWDVSDTTGTGGNAVKANPSIINYLNNGGILYVNGLDMMYDIFGTTITDFVAGNFIYDYMGISRYVQAGSSDLGIPSISKTTANAINSYATLSFAFSSLNYADGFGLTGTSISLYDFPVSANAWSGMSAVVMNKPVTGGTLITNGNELAMLGNGSSQSQDTVDLVVKEYLDYFSNLPNSIFTIKPKVFEINAYPNPVSSVLNLNFKMENNAMAEISIFDNVGRKIHSGKVNALQGENKTQIDVSGLKTGIYILHIQSAQSFSHYKFIKE